MAKNAYAKAGVDIVKADRFVTGIAAMVRATHNKDVIKIPNGYAGLYKINAKQYLAATTDGVGTKLKLAFELKDHSSVGIDLVAMSVNDLICVGARPLFFLDYFATGKLDLKISKSVLSGITQGCRESGVALIGGETAEMPGFYEKNEYDLGGFAVGIVDRKELLDGRRLRSGDVLIGLESSGIHSNGFSLVRKLLKPSETKLKKTCLTPTRLYVKAALGLRDALGPSLKGLAHITGSGFLNIPRLNEHFHYDLDLTSSGIPKLFLELKKRGRLSWEELFTTFNSGLGLIAVVEPTAVSKTQQVLKRLGYKNAVVGRVGSRAKGAPIVRVAGQNFQVELKY